MKQIILFFTFFIQFSFSFGQEKLTEIISKSEKAVCLIKTFDKNRALQNIGTGFFIDSIGTCVSNYHVLKDYVDAEIITHDGRTYKIDKTLKSSSESDIIVFKIEADTVLNFLQIQKLLPEKGENILVIGNPVGLEWSVSEGIISSVRETLIGNVLQITAPISPGNSGSPVLDYHGNVIGIATFLITEGQNLNFALHISVLDSVRSNVALFENPLSKSEIPNDFEIAKSHIDSLVAGTELFSKNKVPKEIVINYIEQFIESYPTSSYGYIKKGDYYDNLWEFEKAFEFYSKAISIEPNNPEVYKKRAIFLRYYSYPFMSDKLQEKISIAINDLKKYGTFSDEFLIESYSMIASCYDEIDNDNLAIEYYSKYIDGNLAKGNTDISTSYVSRALLYWHLDKFDLANQDFDEAIKLSPTCYTFNWKVHFLLDYEKYNEASKIFHDNCISTYEDYYNKALILLNIDGDLKKAEYSINKSIEIVEDYVSKKIMEEIELEKYYRLRAIISDINENYVNELRDLNNILRVNPSLKSDYTISKWIVDIKYNLKDYLGCLKELNLLIEANPDKPDLFEMKGMTLSMLHDDIGAIKAYGRAIELNPQDGRLYRLRGLSKYYSDDKSGACSDWSKAGELGEYKAYEHIKEYCNY